MRTELVGRARELAALTNHLESALEKRPRVVCCAGEPGVGKTRLVKELATLAERNGVSVAWGNAADSAGAPPYWPWRQVLRAVAASVDVAAIAEENRLTADLGRLAPDVFGLNSPLGKDGASTEDRFRQFDSVGRLLREVTLRRPLVIVLDDAHWADDGSLLLLRHVVRTLTDERLLLVVNHRNTEPLHPVLVTALPREPATRSLDLRGLPAVAVGRQLAALVGHDVTEARIAQVHLLTGGNPFFVGELGRVLAEQGFGDSAADLPATVTPNVRAAIAARLDRLSPECALVLRAASIVGREFSVAVLAPMVGPPVLDFLGQLDEAIAAGIIEADPGSGTHRFAHALVRDAIEAGMGTPERVRLHRMAAQAIEEVHATRLEPHLSDLARHWAVASVLGQRAQAARWIERAAAEAMRRLAFEDGARLYRLALTAGGGELDNLVRCRLLLALATALRLTGDLAAQLAACQEAADVARALHRPDLVAWAALALDSGGSDESDRTAERLCEEALAVLDTGAEALRARIFATLSGICMYRGDLAAAGVASERALVAAERCGDPSAMVAALRARQLVRSDPDGVEERVQLAEHMLALGGGSNPQTQMWARLWHVDAMFQRGDLAGVAHQLSLLAWCVENVRGPEARWQLLRCRAALAQAQGRFDDALRLALAGYAEFAPTGNVAAFHVRNGILAAAGHHIGHDVSGSIAASGLAAGTAQNHDFPTDGVILTIAPALLLAADGRLGEAARLYRTLGPVADWRPMPHVVTVSYAFGILVAAALEAVDDVAVLRERLVRFRGHHVASGAGAVAYQGPVELYLGLAAAAIGQLDHAVADLDEARRICAANGAAGHHVEAQYELSAVLARRAQPGDVPRARSLAGEAATGAAVLGMAPFVEKASLLLQRLDTVSSHPLTAREREVADLVAQGLTNREIATRLYLSERTAQNHVQHILTKLDLSNRSQIAVWITTRVSTRAE